MKKKEKESEKDTPFRPSEEPFEFFDGDENECGWDDQDQDWTLNGRMP